ncbi:MAG: hypothetical protein ACTSPI_16185 [Candidatus Heimdallarchaeaceae archaeon]
MNVEKNNQQIIEINKLLGKLIGVNDLRIKKNENEYIFRTQLKKLAAQGYVRTHALFMNLLFEFFEKGEAQNYTMHELEEQLPWLWDKTNEYLHSLEEDGLLSFSRNSSGEKICTLNIATSNKKSSQIINLITHYRNKHILNNEGQKEIFRKYSYYHKKMQLIHKQNKRLEQSIKNIKPVSEKALTSFIEDIVVLAASSNGLAFKKQLLELIKQDPLLLKAIKRRI